VLKLETPLSCFNRLAQRALRISICFCSPARSALGVDLDAKAKASAAMIWVNWWIFALYLLALYHVPSFQEVRSTELRRPYAPFVPRRCSQ
jgi:hypothetical protein